MARPGPKAPLWCLVGGEEGHEQHGGTPCPRVLAAGHHRGRLNSLAPRPSLPVLSRCRDVKHSWSSIWVLSGVFLGGCSGPGLKGRGVSELASGATDGSLLRMRPQILPLAPSFKEGIGQGRTAGRIPSLGEQPPSCRESGAGACCSIHPPHALSPKCSELGSGSCALGGEEQREKSRGAESAPGRMMERG